MDFSTMGAKLEAGNYKDLAAFEADFRLVMANCKQYNGDNTYPFNEAVAMESFFNKRKPSELVWSAFKLTFL
jgi:transcription initiation factor TFIID subunit 2